MKVGPNNDMMNSLHHADTELITQNQVSEVDQRVQKQVEKIELRMASLSTNLTDLNQKIEECGIRINVTTGVLITVNTLFLAMGIAFKLMERRR